MRYIYIILIIILLLILYYYSESSVNTRYKYTTYTILCHKEDYKYLCEYITSVFPKNKLLLYNDKTQFDVGTYMCIRRIPILLNSITPPTSYRPAVFEIDGETQYYHVVIYNEESPRLPDGCKVAFLNIEQLTDPLTLLYVKRFMLPTIRYFDYSRENVELYGRGTYLPYKENKEETKRLKLYMTDTPIDICFVGGLSIRRKKTIEELSKLGYIIDVIHNEFGDNRDQRIGWAKLLVNIHTRDNWNVYESIRCERWRFAGKPIVSEYSLYTPDDINQCSYEDLVSTIRLQLNQLGHECNT